MWLHCPDVDALFFFGICKFGFIFLQLYFSFNCAHAIIFLDGASTSRRIARQRSIHHKRPAQQRVGQVGGFGRRRLFDYERVRTIRQKNSQRQPESTWLDCTVRWTGRSQRFTQLGLDYHYHSGGAAAIKTILRFPLCVSVSQMASCALFCMLRSLRTPPRTMQQWEQYTENKKG